MRPGPCTYFLACALMRLGIPVTAGRRRRDVAHALLSRPYKVGGAILVVLVLWGLLWATLAMLWSSIS